MLSPNLTSKVSASSQKRPKTTTLKRSLFKKRILIVIALIAFTFSSRATNNDGSARTAPKLFDTDGNPLDVSVGNGSEVTVKIKPYKNNYGRFAELIAVKVDNLVEYAEADSDNEEF